MLRTRESEDFLVLNGIQTQSARVLQPAAECRACMRAGRGRGTHQPAVAAHAGIRGAVSRRTCDGADIGRRRPSRHAALMPDQSLQRLLARQAPAWSWWSSPALARLNPEPAIAQDKPALE
jgi:hypothetical protein